ncbi:MAG: GntR family transcriptional regulator [Candidatus Eisenbacteria bacterium]
MHSGLVLSEQSDRPLYLQIVDQVTRRAASGDWPPGHELPSIRGLAADLSVSVITVRKAYAELENAGIVTTRAGRGSFVSESGFDLPKGNVRNRIEGNVREAVDLARTLGWRRGEFDGVVSSNWPVRERRNRPPRERLTRERGAREPSPPERESRARRRSDGEAP